MTDKPTDLRIFDPTRVRALFEAKEAALASAQERIEALERVLFAARVLIGKDRNVLVECHMNPRTGKVEGAQPFLGEYDAALSAIDAALPPSEPGA